MERNSQKMITSLRQAVSLKAGNFSNDYMFLASGLIRAFSHDIDGNEITTYFYPENNMVFEAASFFTHSTSSENIQAVTDCTGYMLSFDKLNLLFHSIPEFREFGRFMLVKGFVEYKQRTLDLITKSVEERYENLMSTKPAIRQHTPLKHIASYLGITDI